MTLTRPAARGTGVAVAVASFAIALVALQIAYPVTGGSVRDVITVAVVVAAAGLCLADVVVGRGPRRALAVLAVTAVPGMLVEIVGVRTGWPFGGYDYTGPLGPRVQGVPLLVGLAWTMLAWPSAVVARRLVARGPARVLVGAWAMTAGDLFLDPQMVAAGMWRWHDPSAHLPGVPTVPLTNLLGWLAASLVLSALVQAVLGEGAPNRSGDGTVGTLLYGWLWLGWTVALGAFLHLPAAAAWGTVGMGAVAVPAVLDLLGAQVGRRGVRWSPW